MFTDGKFYFLVISYILSTFLKCPYKTNDMNYKNEKEFFCCFTNCIFLHLLIIGVPIYNIFTNYSIIIFSCKINYNSLITKQIIYLQNYVLLFCTIINNIKLCFFYTFFQSNLGGRVSISETILLYIGVRT